MKSFIISNPYRQKAPKARKLSTQVMRKTSESFSVETIDIFKFI
jgi:hypothetical protein